MNYRDIIAEEMGYTICPLHYETYVHCDEKFEKCEQYIDFKKAIEESENG